MAIQNDVLHVVLGNHEPFWSVYCVSMLGFFFHRIGQCRISAIWILSPFLSYFSLFTPTALECWKNVKNRKTRNLMLFLFACWILLEWNMSIFLACILQCHRTRRLNETKVLYSFESYFSAFDRFFPQSKLSFWFCTNSVYVFKSRQGLD